jgi:hypothetical protein
MSISWSEIFILDKPSKLGLLWFCGKRWQNLGIANGARCQKSALGSPFSQHHRVDLQSAWRVAAQSLDATTESGHGSLERVCLLPFGSTVAERQLDEVAKSGQVTVQPHANKSFSSQTAQRNKALNSLLNTQILTVEGD